jgi:Fe2+ or Zn2+ uptake regulation protein
MPRPHKYDEVEVFKLLQESGEWETANSLLKRLKKQNKDKYDKIQWTGVVRMLNLLIENEQVESVRTGGIKNQMTFYRIKPFTGIRL